MKELSSIKSANMGNNYAPYQKIGHGYLINNEEKKVYCTLFSMPNSQYYKVCIFRPVNMGYNWHSLKKAEENYNLSIRWTEKYFVIEAMLAHPLPINSIAATLAGLIDFKF